MTRIYITGCAKTGTTLVRRLFNAFNLNVCNYNEMAVPAFISSDYDVAKRTSDSVFSNVLPDAEIRRQLGALDDAGVSIVNVVRGRAATLASDNHYVDQARYDSCMKQAREYADHVSFTIAFEDILSDADAVQCALADRHGLERKHRWSEYPDFVEIAQESPHTHTGLYQLRPIGANKPSR